MYICIYIYVYIYKYMILYTYICIYICIHTGPDARRRRYGGHGSGGAGAGVAAIQFSADSGFLMSAGGSDGCVLQWRLLEWSRGGAGMSGAMTQEPRCVSIQSPSFVTWEPHCLSIQRPSFMTWEPHCVSIDIRAAWPCAQEWTNHTEAEHACSKM